MRMWLEKDRRGVYTPSWRATVTRGLARKMTNGVGGKLVAAGIVGAGLYGGYWVASTAFGLLWWIATTILIPVGMVAGVGALGVWVWKKLSE